jgi:hypothetical protein
MKKYFLLFFLPLSFLFCDSVTLYNDSAFELVAIVRAANGKVLAQKTLAPGEQSIWSPDQMSTDLDINYTSTSSYTPYTVVWQCSYEGIYSACYGIASGAMCVATQCAGPHYCTPKPKSEENKENQNKPTACNGCKGNFLK